MAGSVNKVILVGNLGRDPEVRHAPDGSRIVQLSVATSETWKDKTTGERKERTEWHRVVIFNDRLGELAEKYLLKGAKIFIEGQLQTRKWTDTSNVERYTTEVILSKFKGDLTMLDNRSGGSSQDHPHLSDNSNAHSKDSLPPISGSLAAELDDEIPF